MQRKFAYDIMAKKEIEHSSNLHKMKPLRAASLRGFFSFYVVEAEPELELPEPELLLEYPGPLV